MDHQELLEKYNGVDISEYNFSTINFIVGHNGNGKTRIFNSPYMFPVQNTIYINGFEEHSKLNNTATRGSYFIDPVNLYEVFEREKSKFGNQVHVGMQYPRSMTPQEDIIQNFVLEWEAQGRNKAEIGKSEFTGVCYQNLANWDLVDICMAAQYDDLAKKLDNNFNVGKYGEIIETIESYLNMLLGLKSNMVEISKIDVRNGLDFDYQSGNIGLKELKTRNLIFIDLADQTKNFTYTELSDGQKLCLNIIKRTVIWKQYYDVKYVILDEVEVGLHPALIIQLFATIFELFSENTQFFIITHNPQTVSLLGRKHLENQKFYQVENFEINECSREETFEYLMLGAYIDFTTNTDCKLIIVEGKDDYKFYNTLIKKNLLNKEKVHFLFGKATIEGIYPNFGSANIQHLNKTFCNIGLNNHRIILDYDGGKYKSTIQDSETILSYEGRYSLENLLYDPRLMIYYIEKKCKGEILESLKSLNSDQDKINFILDCYGVGDSASGCINVQYGDKETFAIREEFINNKIKENESNLKQFCLDQCIRDSEYLDTTKSKYAEFLPLDFLYFLKEIEEN